MKKMKSTLPNMVIILTGFTLVAGLLLGVVNGITAPVAAKVAAEKQAKALADVTPEFNNDPTAEVATLTVDGTEVSIYPAKKDGVLVGAAILSKTMKGFGGEVQVMVGMDAEGNITGYQVMKHAETPGLGAKMTEWFQKGAKGNVIGKNPVVTELKVTKDAGDVEAITASTISSRAFLDAVNIAGKAMKEYTSGNTGK